MRRPFQLAGHRKIEPARPFDDRRRRHGDVAGRLNRVVGADRGAKGGEKYRQRHDGDAEDKEFMAAEPVETGKAAAFGRGCALPAVRLSDAHAGLPV